jgi:acyl-coenzyme A synthetase/AMP-(fatty) acid ligase
MDDNMKPVKQGETGELYIGGIGVSPGYINASNHNFLTFNNERLYRTGDLFRQHATGMEYLGRVDDLIKVRGFRVEPVEIEEVMDKHPDVQKTVVTLATDKNGHNRMVAHVVLKKGVTKIPIQELRQAIKANLPEYFLPSFFVATDSLPLTANMKVDRRALASSTTASIVFRPDLDQEFEEPATPIERQLAEIWSQAIGVCPCQICRSS